MVTALGDPGHAMHTRRNTEFQHAPAPPGSGSRLRQRRAARRREKLVGARNRRALVDSLRIVARTGAGRGVRRHELLLVDRAAAVRTTVLHIAAVLDQSRAPDPEACSELEKLLRNGCASPLYNRDVHVSELFATLDFVVGRLAA
jgi:hypothetical protein